MSFLIKFFITLLDGSCKVVLGHNWLRVSKSQIDWKQDTMQVKKPEEKIAIKQSS